MIISSRAVTLRWVESTALQVVVCQQDKSCYNSAWEFYYNIIINRSTQVLSNAFLYYLSQCIELDVHCLRLILQDFDRIKFHIFVLKIFDTPIRVVREIFCMRE